MSTTDELKKDPTAQRLTLDAACERHIRNDSCAGNPSRFNSQPHTSIDRPTSPRSDYDNDERSSLNRAATCIKRVAQNAAQRRYLLGPAASPGVRGSAPGLRPMSTQAASPLLVSVGRPGPPKPAVSRAAPQGRAQRSLTPPAMISTRPTEAAISTDTAPFSTAK
jgi:hypothetical protein